jgi:hypothetical protein
MALEYDLYLETALSPYEALRIWLTGVDVESDIKVFNDDPSIPYAIAMAVGCKITAALRDNRSEKADRILIERVGFLPNVHLTFRVGRTIPDLKLAETNIPLGTIKWLENRPDDTALTNSGGYVMVVRISGELTFDLTWLDPQYFNFTLPYNTRRSNPPA